MKASGLVVVALCGLGVAGSAWGGIGVEPLGTGKPPVTVPLGSGIGGKILYGGPDARPEGAIVVESQIGADCRVLFGIPVSHQTVGETWPNWSHGYDGSVYYTIGRPAVTLTPVAWAPVDYFGFYAQPGPFATFTMTAVARDDMGGVSPMALEVSGDGGASGWGFWADGGMHIDSVIIDSDVPFAVGEFGVHLMTPAPGTVAMLGAAGLLSRRRRLGSRVR